MSAVDSVAPSVIPLKGLRGSIARSMTAGWQAPRVALGMEVDMTRCLQLCAEVQQASGADKRISVTPVVLRAVALSLRKYPYMNALMTADGIEQKPDIHVGLAVSLEDGLAVPVIRNADTKSIAALAAESGQSAVAARAGTLPLKAYQGGTFTVTNLGMAGVDWFTPILNPPQVGILGLSRVAEKAVVRDGLIGIAPMTTLTLVFDHRAVDGYPAALFLKDVKARLESCESL
jgi:pyruvate/2-oxoglutarate dehydrogenase complex dihydrolipoamide acyltransferase (E2) component